MKLGNKVTAFCYVMITIKYLTCCWHIFKYSKDPIRFDFGYGEMWLCSNFVLIAAFAYSVDKYASLAKDNMKEFALRSYYTMMAAVGVAGLLSGVVWVCLGYDIALVLSGVVVYAFLFDFITIALTVVGVKVYGNQGDKVKDVSAFAILPSVMLFFVSIYFGYTFDTAYLILTISSVACVCLHRPIFGMIARQ